MTWFERPCRSVVQLSPVIYLYLPQGIGSAVPEVRPFEPGTTDVILGGFADDAVPRQPAGAEEARHRFMRGANQLEICSQ